jgi:hypothetical protein
MHYESHSYQINAVAIVVGNDGCFVVSNVARGNLLARMRREAAYRKNYSNRSLDRHKGQILGLAFLAGRTGLKRGSDSLRSLHNEVGLTRRGGYSPRGKERK